MPLAVCRIQKIKSWGLLTGNEAHVARTRDTPNANPEVSNVQLIGSPNDPNLATLVKNKIGSQKIRSNAVLAVEMLLSASAEYFRPNAPQEAGTYDKERLHQFVQATTIWLSNSWGELIIRAELHLDEITPHIHAYVVPLDERGKLNCKALFGTRDKLHKLQDSFASAVEHLGISRGIKGSTAKYTSLKKYYAAVNQESQILDLEGYLTRPQEHETVDSYRQRIIEIISPQLEVINYQLGERERILKQNAQLKQTAFRSEQLRQKLEREVQLLQAKTSKQQDLPLELVAYELGLNNEKRLNNIAKNSFDLVMRVNQCAFDDAVVWLRERFGETQMLTAVAHHSIEQALMITQQTPPTIFVPPAPSYSRWPEVENYLTDTCCIPQKLVQTLHQRGLIYASMTGDAVFFARNLLSEVTGAYLYKPHDPGNSFTLYPGSKRSSGWFYLSMGGSDKKIATAILVSSPIEALSLVVLNAPHKDRTLYLNVDSEYAKLPVEFLLDVPNVVIATSKEIAKAVKKALPDATLLSPKNWNHHLQHHQGAKSHVTLG